MRAAAIKDEIKAFKKRKLSFLASSLILHPFVPSADEVDDLYAVAVFEGGVRPGGAAHDLTIQFYGQSLGRERKSFDQFPDRELVFDFASLAVDLYVQAFPQNPLQDG
jgi:hypothetical protein